jgi:hypothetical protein
LESGGYSTTGFLVVKVVDFLLPVAADSNAGRRLARPTGRGENVALIYVYPVAVGETVTLRVEM